MRIIVDNYPKKPSECCFAKVNYTALARQQPCAYVCTLNLKDVYSPCTDTSKCNFLMSYSEAQYKHKPIPFMC